MAGQLELSGAKGPHKSSSAGDKAWSRWMLSFPGVGAFVNHLDIVFNDYNVCTQTSLFW